MIEDAETNKEVFRNLMPDPIRTPKYEVTEDVYTSRKKQHQTMMHYFCALNTLQYKKKIALLEPLFGYMQAQVNNVLCFGL